MLEISVKLESIKARKTRIDYTFSTNEAISDIARIQLLKSKGHLLFTHDPFQKEVEEAMRNKKIGIDSEGFSPSQKLRGVLFQVGRAKGEQDLDEFYLKEMNRIMHHYKKSYL